MVVIVLLTLFAAMFRCVLLSSSSLVVPGTFVLRGLCAFLLCDAVDGETGHPTRAPLLLIARS